MKAHSEMNQSEKAYLFFRVNAQAQGYEYMASYIEEAKQVGREENAIGIKLFLIYKTRVNLLTFFIQGWYHSHPGYGCWLSGIDVGTQSLNQSYQVI